MADACSTMLLAHVMRLLVWLTLYSSSAACARVGGCGGEQVGMCVCC